MTRTTFQWNGKNIKELFPINNAIESSLKEGNKLTFYVPKGTYVISVGDSIVKDEKDNLIDVIKKPKKKIPMSQVRKGYKVTR